MSIPPLGRTSPCPTRESGFRMHLRDAFLVRWTCIRDHCSFQFVMVTAWCRTRWVQLADRPPGCAWLHSSRQCWLCCSILCLCRHRSRGQAAKQCRLIVQQACSLVSTGCHISCFWSNTADASWNVPLSNYAINVLVEACLQLPSDVWSVQAIPKVPCSVSRLLLRVIILWHQ